MRENSDPIMEPRWRPMFVIPGLNDYQPQAWREPPEIARIAGHDSLSSSLGANGDVGVDDIGGPNSRKQ